MSNKKILVISSEFPPGPGGIGKHAFDLTRALSGLGFEVTVFTSQDFSSENEIETFNNNQVGNFKISRFKRSGLKTYFQRWGTIRNWIKKEQPSNVIVTGRFSLWMGFLISKKYRKSIPVHAFVHGSELSRKNNLFYFFTIKSLSTPDSIWAVSSFTKNLISQHAIRKDIQVLPNGLWLDDWSKSQKDSAEIKLHGTPSLLTIGQLSKRKGQQRVIKALPRITKTFPSIHYHLAGIPTDQDQLTILANNLHVKKNITIHGRIESLNKLESIYKGTDLFIMLSENQQDGDSEGFGIAILEANYFGKPAIGAIGCGIEDAISDGVNGKLVDGNNHEEIVNAIREIMDHYQGFSERSRQWALQHDWRELIKRFESIQPTSTKN